MLRGMNLVQEVKERDSFDIGKPKENNCPFCGVNGITGAICQTHLELMKNYDQLADYLNTLGKFNNNTIHILDYAISDRKSYIINDVPVENGRLQIEEYLKRELGKGKSSSMTIWMERTLKEILELQKAKILVLGLIEKEKVET